MNLSCDDLLELRCGEYSARVAPAAGGRISMLSWHAAQTTIPLLVEYDGRAFDEHDWPKAGLFAMLPFANRLPRAGFNFRGRVIRPDCGPAGFPVHGFAHRRIWKAVDRSAKRVVMSLAYDGHDAGWPWSFSAEQVVELDHRGISVILRVINESAEPMPLVLGLHPYHPVAPDLRSSDLQFVASARRDFDEQGSATETAGEPAFAMQRGDTAAFTGWTGKLHLRAVQGGVLAITSSDANCLVLHRPGRGDYVCAEPVTSLPGYMARHPEASELAPGQTRNLSWTCGFVPADVR